MTKRRNLDTMGIGKLAFSYAAIAILEAGHLLQPIDGDVDIGIDGYIRIRKRVKGHKIIANKKVPFEDKVDTGNLVGVQVKGVSKTIEKGSLSYYISRKDRTTFGVNFSTPENLLNKRKVWDNFVGPMILIFVDLDTKKCWWEDLGDPQVYESYSIIMRKEKLLLPNSFKVIKQLGKELFIKNEIPEVTTKNNQFFGLKISDLSGSARDLYRELANPTESILFAGPTINPVLGEIKYSRSGWEHVTRLNRRKMRIINSLLLLGVSRQICQEVPFFTKVKKGICRETNRYIKKVDFLTLRAHVYFNYRQSSVVQVVLRRVKTYDKIQPENKIDDEVFFHSVYEPYRKE